MTQRAKIIMTWSIKMSHAGPFSTMQDYEFHARNILVTGFSNYKPDMRFAEVKEYGAEFRDITIEWDVDLDMVPGTFHQPEDHAQVAKTYLRDQIRLFTAAIKVESITVDHPKSEKEAA